MLYSNLQPVNPTNLFLFLQCKAQTQYFILQRFLRGYGISATVSVYAKSTKTTGSH